MRKCYLFLINIVCYRDIDMWRCLVKYLIERFLLCFDYNSDLSCYDKKECCGI